MVLTWIYLMINNIEPLFICLSISLKYLFFFIVLVFVAYHGCLFFSYWIVGTHYIFWIKAHFLFFCLANIFSHIPWLNTFLVLFFDEDILMLMKSIIFWYLMLYCALFKNPKFMKIFFFFFFFRNVCFTLQM